MKVSTEEFDEAKAKMVANDRPNAENNKVIFQWVVERKITPKQMSELIIAVNDKTTDHTAYATADFWIR